MKQEIYDRFARLGIILPEVFLPSENVDMEKWAVIACDQFTSERDYWERVKQTVGSSPSTLNLILPECYLEDEESTERISAIHAKMVEYLDAGILEKQSPGFVLIDRKTEHVHSRKGLLLAIDLERYDFNEGSKALIRPTEGTIKERLPARMKVREGASLDLPHILFLIDDPDGMVIEKAFQHREEMKLLYDFDLMEDGGHVTGRKVDDPALLEELCNGLEKLIRNRGLLFAVGDGNHSLASAKTIWENLKASGGVNDAHPARYAMVEAVNIHDSGLLFEPIHRVLFNIDIGDFTSFLSAAPGCTIEEIPGGIEGVPPGEAFDVVAGSHRIGYTAGGRTGVLSIQKPEAALAAEFLQEMLDEYLADHSNASIDYIHGEAATAALGEQAGNIAFFLPPLDKRTFFEMIVKRGAFPRKTFSLGEAREKRYYLESRTLVRL